MDSRGVPKESAKDIPSQDPEPKIAKGKKGREKKNTIPLRTGHILELQMKFSHISLQPYLTANGDITYIFCPVIFWGTQIPW